ncbi:hypothetical protein BDM02DRAFT_3115500 [Thelephora ganbajun]|uniref:Uncharacterized protein n=1 Tax=Thelephora ganbajun TaxID=370292 RepID=A0ACB6ZGS2_THEGA|nr:hypothetical protein BDM02DRAFT_3115500 [Thelephora ganbajun]
MFARGRVVVGMMAAWRSRCCKRAQRPGRLSENVRQTYLPRSTPACVGGGRRICLRSDNRSKSPSEGQFWVTRQVNAVWYWTLQVHSGSHRSCYA